MGLSPRVRGSLHSTQSKTVSAGSIPACAGEPEYLDANTAVDEVYPRVCGGAGLENGDQELYKGLSPRVRGSQVRSPWRSSVAGSIPACAGEPACISVFPETAWVYPRVCGGANPSTAILGGQKGLSPRVRGSPCGPQGRPSGPGSIPACAGEPGRNGQDQKGIWVYPRVCGGAIASQMELLPMAGLSPRVRGSRRPRCSYCSPSGSIPACAGEPQVQNLPHPLIKVYPRVCGGAKPTDRPSMRDIGLSPRVRGSP